MDQYNDQAEMRKLNQMITQKQFEFQKQEKLLKNKVANLEHEINDKSNIISHMLIKQTQIDQIASHKHCNECDRLHGIIKEMEKQLEYYKSSVLRRGSTMKADNTFENSDLKTYIKDQDNLELESMLDGNYKDNNFGINTPISDYKNDVCTKLSFISLSHQKQLSNEKDLPAHYKNISQSFAPGHVLATDGGHRSN
jgi:hypothetical protein